jgi:dolichol kinase
VSLLRKLIHLAMALLPAVGWWISFEAALLLAGVFLLVSLAIEVARRWWSWVDRLLWRFISSVFRVWEGQTVLGSTWFALGALGALLLARRDAGGTAILFLAWGDPAAEFVGRRLGGGRRGKTVAGSLGCLAACLVAAWVGVRLGGLAPLAALAGAVVATLVEQWPPPPDDNVWMPILSGLAMGLIQWLLEGL